MTFQTAWKRAALTIAAVGALIATLGNPAVAQSTGLVISQVYGGGGSTTGSPSFKYDFIELYNKGAVPVDLDGLSVQYASASGTFNAAFALPNVSVPPGGYYLIRTGAPGTVGADLPVTEDASTNLNLGAASGKVALVQGTTALGSGVNCDGAKAVALDLVGYGSANCFEGAAAVPALTNTTAALRNGTPRGAVDTDQNGSDFTIGAPDPRNSQYGTLTPPTVTGVTFTPDSANVGATISVSATVTPGSNSGAIASVTLDLTPIGGTSVTLTGPASGGTFTGTFVVPANATPGARTLNVTATDAGSTPRNGVGGASFEVTVLGGPLNVKQFRALPQSADTVVEVTGIVTTNNVGYAYIQDPDSVSGGAGLAIFDGTTNSGVTANGVALKEGDRVVVSGKRLDFRGEAEVETATRTEGADVTIVSSGNPIPAVKTITVPQAINSNDAFEGQLARLNNVTVLQEPVKTNSSTIAWFFPVQDAQGNKITVYIQRNATQYALDPPGVPANPVNVEPQPAPVDLTTVTFPDIHVGDIFNITGIVAEDTAIPTYTPTGSPAKLIKPRSKSDFQLVGQGLITSATATPNPVERGQVLSLSVTTSAATNSTVRANLSSLGGSASQVLSGSGSGPYTYDFIVPANAPLGQASIVFTVTNGANTQTTTVNVAVFSSQPISIAQARALPDGTRVTVAGVVTATTVSGAGSVYVQDATGGIYVFGSGFNPDVGNIATVTGTVTTFSGQKELDYGGNLPTAQVGGAVPAPQDLTIAQWTDNLGELAISDHLTITGERVAGPNRVFTVTDGTGTGEIFISSRAGFTDFSAFTTGAAFKVTGPVDVFTTGGTTVRQIKPRGPEDVLTSTPVPTTRPGDINKSGAVDAADVMLALRVAGGLVSAADQSVSVPNGDVAPRGALDGRITLLDAVRIARSLQQKDTLP